MIKERLSTLGAGSSSQEARIAALHDLQDLVAPLDNANDLKARLANTSVVLGDVAQFIVPRQQLHDDRGGFVLFASSISNFIRAL